MKENIRILAASVALGAFVILTVHIFGQLLHANDNNTTSQRLTSLGTPKVVPLDPKKGEQKVIFSDPSIVKNWGLMGTGGEADIRANAAWNITQGDRRVVVAVIDTGADIHHPDLADNIWINPGESGKDANGQDKATNGIDDDGNGYIDDIHGWDFVNNSPQVIDNHGHGTHIAGIIGAVGDNGIGISGVCPHVSLMILKYFDPRSRGNDNLRNTIRAIRYAVDMGANIINYSGGGTDPNDDEFAAVKYAKDKGVLFVAAAGNEHSDSDVAHYYPADYNLSNIISVTAINSAAQILRSSNFGTRTVHIAAPGEGIYSTLPGGNYGYMTGTSQATAFVTGVAALILSHNKDFSAMQVKEQILKTADEIPGLRDKTISGGKLNSYAALAIQPAIPATGIARVEQPNGAGVIDTDAVKADQTVLFGEESETQDGTGNAREQSLSKLLRAINRPLAGVPVPARSEAAKKL